MKLAFVNKRYQEKESSLLPKTVIKFGIRTKVILFATLLGIIPVMVVGGAAYRIASNSLEQKIAEAKLFEAKQLAHNLKGFLAERTANMETIVRFIDRTVRNGAEGKIEATIVAKDREISSDLDRFIKEYSYFSSITVYDPQGKELVSSTNQIAINNPSQQDYFQQAIEKKTAIIGEPKAMESDRDVSIHIATPMQDKSGKVQAIVVGKISVDAIETGILRTAATSSLDTVYQFIDSQGKIFHTSDRIADRKGLAIATVLPNYTKIVDRQKQTWQEKTILKQGNKIVEGLHARSSVRLSTGLQWNIVTSTDTSIAFAAEKQLLNSILFGTMATAGIAAILAGFSANRGVRPILQAGELIERLRQGNLDSRMNIQGSDELALLGTNVNRMAADLQKLLQQQQVYSDRLFSQNDVLKSLARNDSLLAGDVVGAARAFTEAIAQSIRSSRVSIWLFSPRRDAIECIDLYEPEEEKHKNTRSLKFEEYYEYFQELLQDRPLVAEDVLTNPATQKLYREYLAPANIVSKLDVPVQSGGMVAGVICCEQVGEKRQWQAEEVLFVGSVANLIALAIESEQLQKDIANLLESVSEIEDGNLTARAVVSDRTTGLVSDTLNRSIERLGSIMAQVSQTANLVSHTSEDLGRVTEQVATNAREQSQKATEVLKLARQVKVQVEQSAEQIDMANSALFEVNSTVESGQEALMQMNQGIEVLREGTNQIVQQMKTLGEFVGLADQFVQEQGQIATLTQVLALNATLVAARASEQKDPMQFAVVAREFEAIAAEVSTLAQQTNDGLASLQQRTEQINNVVSYVDGQIQNLGGLVNGFTIGVEQSNRIYHSVNRVTQEVVRSAETVSIYNQSIVNASQSTAQAMKEIVTLAVRNAQLTQKAQQESTAMESLSDKLLDKVSFFRIGDVSLQETNNFIASIDMEDLDGDLPELMSLDALPDDNEYQTLLFTE
jgi:methyl-accepting chemotaxis protein PixJ